MEKLQRYRLEKAVQDVNESTKQWLQEEIKTLLESNKPYQSKCDYIGYSINSIDEKIKMIDEEMNQLKEYKAKLKSAKDIALSVGAEVFESYGISKIEGNGISSITLTKAASTTKRSVTVTNEQALIDGGIYKKVVDMDLLKNYYERGEYKEFIESNTFIEDTTISKPSKLKVNKRRSVNSTNYNSDNIADVA